MRGSRWIWSIFVSFIHLTCVLLVNSSCRYISKYCFTRPLTNKGASIVSTNLVELFYIFAPPKIIQSHNGKESTNFNMSDVCSEWQILHKFIRLVIHNLKDMLRGPIKQFADCCKRNCSIMNRRNKLKLYTK